jgi:ABC-type antimicrobial peptide transport system permease subunit
MPEFAVRTNLPVSQVGATARRSAAAVDGQLRISRIQTLNKTVNDYLERERLLASLSSTFGVIALILVTIGVYGVIAYDVTRRVSEIGLRIALGAARAQVLRMVLTEATVIPLAGIMAGAPLAYAASRVAASLLFGVLPGDISSLLGAAALILVMAMAAALIPALRAMRIDPITVLRHE